MPGCRCSPAQDGVLPCIQEHLGSHLASQGLDIMQPFRVQDFNCHNPKEHALPIFGRASTLALLIGNSNAIWEPFIKYLSATPEDKWGADPLDNYLKTCITAAVADCISMLCSSCCRTSQTPCNESRTQAHEQRPMHEYHHTQEINYEIRFSFDSGPKFVNMLRAAHFSGLAYHSTITHLCMHPVFGPWFALRAVVVFDLDCPDDISCQQLSCPWPELEQEAADKMNELLKKGGFDNFQQHWQDWAQLRQIGAKHTPARYWYSPDQLEYHYTKKASVLLHAIQKLSTAPDRNQPAAI
eukprot:jgi/Chrzof1/9091/Cz03g35220.t1